MWLEGMIRGGRQTTDKLRRKLTGQGTSLVVQWLRICLPMQGTWVSSLVWELRSHMAQEVSLCAPKREASGQQQRPTAAKKKNKQDEQSLGGKRAEW